MTFRVGDRVEFRREGKLFVGLIGAVAQTSNGDLDYLVVCENTGRWRWLWPHEMIRAGDFA